MEQQDVVMQDAQPAGPGLESVLNDSMPAIRALQLNDLEKLFNDLIPSERRPSDHFLAPLTGKKRHWVLLSCVLVFLLSLGKIVPRDFQLEAVIGSMENRDGIIVSGTGSGKTLIMIMLQLLCPMDICLLVVPLKRLQYSQLEAFTVYGIKTVAINEETPDDLELWKGISDGHYKQIITTPEQLTQHEGHFTRFAKLLRARNRKFIKKIRVLEIDELHSIYTLGMPKHGQPAFRPAYGKFDAVRLLFPKSVSILGFSATIPPHMLHVIQKSLSISPDHFLIRCTCNRPNITYATHKVLGSLGDFRNLQFLLPAEALFSSPNQIPLTIIFHDDTKECSDAAVFLDNLLPQQYRSTGIVKHYHSNMLRAYLDLTYNAFQEGTCRILHTCSGMESGIDFKKADVVIQYGMPADGTTTIQRGGRGGRDMKDKSLFLIMYEPWAKEVNLDAVSDGDDPDRPFSLDNKKYGTKMARTSVFSYRLIQSNSCIRCLFAGYLDDQTPEARSYISTCCDRDSDGFDLSSFFPGKFLTEDELKVKKTRKGGPSRPVKHRALLEELLQGWRRQAHQRESLRAILPASWILDDTQITLLATIAPAKLTSAQDITQSLNETEEWSSKWSSQVFELISTFIPPADAPISKKRKAAPAGAPVSLSDRSNVDTQKRAGRQARRA